MLTTPNLDSGAWVAGKESDLSPIAVRCVCIIRAVKRCVPVAIDFGRHRHISGHYLIGGKAHITFDKMSVHEEKFDFIFRQDLLNSHALHLVCAIYRHGLLPFAGRSVTALG